MTTPTTLRLLLVEDNESDADVLLLELRRAGFDVRMSRVEDANAFIDALNRGADWDLIIADYNLPAFDGIQALEIYHRYTLDIPFFLVSGTVGEEVAVTAMKAGAHDYLIKDNLVRLGAAVRRELRDAQLRRESQREHQRFLESEQRFAEIFRNSPVPIMVTRFEDGTILDINQALTDLLGFEREDAIGRPTPRFGAWSSAQDRQAFVDEIIRTGRARTIERTIPAKDGRLVSIVVYFNVIELSGERRLVVTMLDITARKQAEETLRESEEHFRLLVESSNELILEVAMDGTVLYASPNHTTIVGRTPAEIVGRSAFEHVHPDDLPGVLAHFRTRDASGLFRNRFADGSWHWLEASGRAFQTHAGEQRGVIVSRDVTERIRAEDTRKRLEEQLRQAQKLEALGTLAGGIAHDFNNILTAIIAFTDLARMEIDRPSEVLAHLAEVRLAGDRARDLVKQILAFSRKQKHERQSTRLQDVLREALKLLRSTLPATIEIASRVDDAAPTVLADPSQVHQVVMNLGTNAAHAMRERPGRIDVELGVAEAGPALLERIPELTPGRYVRIIVSDTGGGIGPETLKRIFEPFFTTKAPGEGTGLGLAVCHGIMRDHDGAITVRSTPGQGTTFELFFPAHVQEPVAAKSASEEMPIGRGERLLVIDDEKAICASMKSILTRLGYRVAEYSDPVAAVEAFRAEPGSFDLVLTDLTMPRMTGIDVARAVLEARPGLPVLLTSGFSASWTPEAVRSLGIHDLVAKPVSLPMLALMLRDALDRHPRVDRAAR
ncbi:MAG: PAS domain S-box protein [Opitutaceae bacterium]|nr:PAS domain S-box protein [Opitutaceae bacterium]